MEGEMPPIITKQFNWNIIDEMKPWYGQYIDEIK